MHVKINGKDKEFNADTLTASALLKSLDLSLDNIALELNKEIVPKANFESVMIRDNDLVEIVQFVGGG